MIRVNQQHGRIKSGPAKGEKCIILNYTIDGKKWINHGIYCRGFIKVAPLLASSLMATGKPKFKRVGVVYPLSAWGNYENQ
jgi:hypothetical protein